MLGVDVLVDETGEPWLLELNDHPSLSISRLSPVKAEGAPFGHREDKHESSHPSREVSVVDERIKVPMLTDALRIYAELHGLSYHARSSPWELADLADLVDSKSSYELAFDTSFVELTLPPDLRKTLRIFERLRHLFDQHTPTGSPSHQDVWISRSSGGDGAKWKAVCFARFLAAYAGWSQAASTELFGHVCGGRRPRSFFGVTSSLMDLMDFAVALAEVARCTYRLEALRSGNGAAPENRMDLLVHMLDAWSTTSEASFASWVARGTALSETGAALRSREAASPLQEKRNKNVAPSQTPNSPAR